MKDTDYNVWGSLERANTEIKLLRTALAEKETEAWNNTKLYLETMQKLEAELEKQNNAAAWCDKHKPSTGYRSICLVCALERLSHALSQISYICDEPNEMGCSKYDTSYDEAEVIEDVTKLKEENKQLREELAELKEEEEDEENNYVSVHRYKGDPVCVKDGKYYFWDETWSEVSCSFNTIEECDEALNAYFEGLE